MTRTPARARPWSFARASSGSWIWTWFPIGLALVCGLPAFADEAPLTLHVGVPDPLTEIVSTSEIRDGIATRVDAAWGASVWSRFRLRGGPPGEPPRPDDPRELESVELLPRLAWGSELSLVSWVTPDETASGLLAFGASGVEELLTDAGEGAVVRGAFRSWSGESIALLLDGEETPRVVVLERGPRDLASGGREIAVREIAGLDAASARSIEPETLVFLDGAVALAIEREDRQLEVWMASPDANDVWNARRVAGPFAAMSTRFACSARSAVFLAGDDEELWDVHVLGSDGEVLNLTRSPDAYVDAHGETDRFAISRDDRVVAYNLTVEQEPEVFWHPVERPGLRGAQIATGRTHVTRDERFNPYIDQQVFFFFDARGRLNFDAGHSPSTTDVYLVGATDPESTLNVTHTGSGTLPPFLTRGDLAVREMLSAGDVLLLDANGFEPAASVLASSALDGTILPADQPLVSVRNAFSVGDRVCFSSLDAGGRTVLACLDGERLATLVTGAAGRGDAQPVLSTAAGVWAHVPGAGIVQVDTAGRVSSIASGAVRPEIFLGADGARAVVAREGVDGQLAFSAIDLGSHAETPLPASALSSSTVLSVSGVVPRGEAFRFIRGDANVDGRHDLSDPISTLVFLFRGGPAVACLDAADADDDGVVALTDAVRSLDRLFRASSPLPAPYPEAGVDPTPDALDCAALRVAP